MGLTMQYTVTVGDVIQVIAFTCTIIGAYWALMETGVVYLSTTAVNAFQFKFSSGNIASGVVRVYGLTK